MIQIFYQKFYNLNNTALLKFYKNPLNPTSTTKIQHFISHQNF